MTNVKVGDRIRLIHMPDDPYPIPPGATGTVTSVNELQIGVSWDSGRGLKLAVPEDKFEVIREAGDGSPQDEA